MSSILLATTIFSQSSFGADINWLVVGGGGGGGGGHGSQITSGGGGGAGGFREGTISNVTSQTTYTVTVGGGGSGSSGDGSQGSGSQFGGIVSAGGGGGMRGNRSSGSTAGSGGSGGGGGGHFDGTRSSYGGSGNTPSTTPAQGSDGGDSIGVRMGGGGGGASAAGHSPTSNSNSAYGGTGKVASITGLTYAGGGGAGAWGYNSLPGAGGSGGGGGGGHESTGNNGTANTGGGGGGGAANATSGLNNGQTFSGGDGGSGVVVIQYDKDRALSIPSGLSGSTALSTDGKSKITTFTSGSGTITLGVIGSASAYTQGLRMTYYSHSQSSHPTSKALMDALFNGATQLGSSVINETIHFSDNGTNGGGQGQTKSKPSGWPSSNYAVKFEGLIYAPTTGTYTFGIDSDDAADIFVNNNLVAHFYDGHGFENSYTSGSNQVSSTISLTGGQYYQFTVRFEEASGDDGISVGWKKPGDSSYSLIPAANLFYI